MSINFIDQDKFAAAFSEGLAKAVKAVEDYGAVWGDEFTKTVGDLEKVRPAPKDAEKPYAAFTTPDGDQVKIFDGGPCFGPPVPPEAIHWPHSRGPMPNGATVYVDKGELYMIPPADTPTIIGENDK